MIYIPDGGDGMKRKKIFWGIATISAVMLLIVKYSKIPDKAIAIGAKTQDVNVLLILLFFIIILIALRIAGYVR